MSAGSRSLDFCGQPVELDLPTLGEEMHALIARLFPICRSITGNGVRETLRVAQGLAPVEIHEVHSGTPVLDWTVPHEWNVREAWIKAPNGEKVVDFAAHNLHLLQYSVPFRGRLSLAELEEHLHSLPEQPELIPYRTSYYREQWGFCLPHRLRQSLTEGEYEVRVDTTLEDGSLTYGELLLPGASPAEVLLSCHVCHPSLANDNLSGLVVMLGLARELARLPRRLSYRFLFIPGTIGSITWLARNREILHRVEHGLVASNLGDGGAFHYKRSRAGNAAIDRAVALVLRDSGREHHLLDFVPFGYDERQYNSPGFALPVGLLSRTPWGQYPEYHTSADNPSFVPPQALADSLALYLEVMAALETNGRFLNLSPYGEPQLGRRGLYGTIGGAAAKEREVTLLWVLNLADGKHSLLDVAERSGLPLTRVAAASRELEATGLLRRLEPEETP